LANRLNYLWRLFATGLSFFLFGAVGVALWGGLFPLLAPFLGRGRIRTQRSRRLMQQVFRLYMNFMRAVGILDYRVSDPEVLNQSAQIVVANHPCLLDIVFLISQIRNASCIVKPALIKNPFMRIPIRAMGYIYAEDPETLLERCAEELHGGSVLIVFPEGTRTTPGLAIKFQRGAAAIALHAQAPLLPVLLDCSPTTLTKQERWYQIPQKKFTLSLIVGDHIRLSPISGSDNRSLAARRVTRQLETYFTDRLADHGLTRSRA